MASYLTSLDFTFEYFMSNLPTKAEPEDSELLTRNKQTEQN